MNDPATFSVRESQTVSRASAATSHRERGTQAPEADQWRLWPPPALSGHYWGALWETILGLHFHLPLPVFPPVLPFTAPGVCVLSSHLPPLRIRNHPLWLLSHPELPDIWKVTNHFEISPVSILVMAPEFVQYRSLKVVVCLEGVVGLETQYVYKDLLFIWGLWGSVDGDQGQGTFDTTTTTAVSNNSKEHFH